MKIGIFLLFFMASTATAQWMYSSGRAIQQALELTNPSVESFLATVPGDFSAQHLLLFGSQSNQQADLLFPRVAMFNENMVMTFNGHGFGSNEVEMIQFNKQNRSFDFFALIFENGKLEVQENPKRCFACHTEKAPLWFSASIHPFWPGVFGSGTALATKADEEKALANWISLAAKSKRYKILFPHLINTTPYFSKDKEAKSLFERNGTFELQLAEWMAQFTFQRLKSEPLYSSFRPALLAVLSCVYSETPKWRCTKPQLLDLIQDLIPKNSPNWKERFELDLQFVKSQTEQASVKKWQHQSKSLGISYEELRAREKDFKGAPPVIENHLPVSAGLLLIERLFYLHGLTESLSMSPYDQQFEYAGILAPWGVLGRLEKLLFESAKKDYPELHLQNLRKTQLQKLSTIGEFKYSTWVSIDNMTAALQSLHRLGDKPFPCEFILTKAAND